MGKIQIGLIFGGRSGEHEVSVRSATSIYKALDKTKYDVTLLGIDKLGKWQIAPPKWLPGPTEMKTLEQGDASGPLELIDTTSETTVFIPMIHGTYGEDGSLQGFLEMLDVAYVGAGVLGSAVGMDKDVQKRLLKGAGINVGEFIVLRDNQLTYEAREFVEQRGYPVFVKPVNLGSSVGVTKVHNEEELGKAVSLAFEYDTKVMIEEFIAGRELEIAVLGREASVVGEIIAHHEFYDYDAKYIDPEGAEVQIPADDLSEKKIEEIQKLAMKVFTMLECEGMARVDLFMKEDGELVINEINTLPGFTNISMYPKLWEASGVPYPKLLDRLIELAIERKRTKDTLRRSYS